MKHLLQLGLLVLFISCQKKETANTTPPDPDSYQIQLKEQQAAQVLNQTFGISKSAGWLDKMPSFLTDIPEADTLEVRLTSFLGKRKLKKLYANGSLDSIKYPVDSVKRGVYVINGYRDEQQFIIIDANNNYSFKDDTVFYFNKDFKHRIAKESLLRDSIPFITVTYEDFDGEKLVEKRLKVKPLPEKIPYQEFLTKEQLKQIHPRQLNDIFSTKLFYQQDWEGILELEEKQYLVNVMDGLRGPSVFFYDTPRDSISIDRDKQNYRIKDSVKLGSHYYIIDSITSIKDELFIRKLDIKAPKWGYLAGEKSVDFEFQNIAGEERKISEVLQDKEYVLIDFWGTWCAPCKELTPDLVRMSKEYKDKLALMSVAYERKKEPLLKYIDKHQMEWEHIYLEGNAKSAKKGKPKLIKNFAIEGYPTFLLINKQLDIVYRGIGRPGLEKIEEVIRE